MRQRMPYTSTSMAIDLISRPRRCRNQWLPTSTFPDTHGRPYNHEDMETGCTAEKERATGSTTSDLSPEGMNLEDKPVDTTTDA